MRPLTDAERVRDLFGRIVSELRGHPALHAGAFRRKVERLAGEFEPPRA